MIISRGLWNAQFMPLGKHVSKYIEFSNLDTDLDFQLHGKDGRVEKNISRWVGLLYPKILTGLFTKCFRVFLFF